jgi:hypothetical protein
MSRWRESYFPAKKRVGEIVDTKQHQGVRMRSLRWGAISRKCFTFHV